MERVFGLDLLRCVAVLMVLVAHARFLLRPIWPGLQALSIYGFLGVELFFVLSGFLIGGILLKTFGDAPGRGALLNFWVRRWFRTLPNYYLFLIINVALWLLRGRSGHGLVPYAGFLQNLWWECPFFFNESWSLTIEEWFYLLFPLLLLAFSRLRRGRGVAVLTSLATLFLLSNLARILVVSLGHPTWDAGIRKVVIYRFDGLMLGVLGAWAKTTWPALWPRLRLPGAVIGAALAVLVHWNYYNLDRNVSFYARTFYFTTVSLSVFCLLPALDAWRVARGTLADWVRNISLWSYSLYLCHLPVLTVLEHFLGDPEVEGLALGVPRILLITVLFLGVSVWVSSLAYRRFERPAMALRERFRNRG